MIPWTVVSIITAMTGHQFEPFIRHFPPGAPQFQAGLRQPPPSITARHARRRPAPRHSIDRPAIGTTVLPPRALAATQEDGFPDGRWRATRECLSACAARRRYRVGPDGRPRWRAAVSWRAWRPGSRSTRRAAKSEWQNLRTCGYLSRPSSLDALSAAAVGTGTLWVRRVAAGRRCQRRERTHRRTSP